MARLLYRLGTFSAGHRRTFLLGWLLALLALCGIALSGMRFGDGGFDVPGTEAGEALQVMNREFPVADADAGSLQLVLQAPAGQKITDPMYAGAVADVLASTREVEHVRSVSDPFDAEQPYVSADGTTAVATVNVTGIAEADAEAVQDDIAGAAERMLAGGLTLRVGGQLGSPVPEILGPTEIIGALIAFGVLLITFGSLAAAGANMAGALVGVGVGILGIFAFSALKPIGSTTPILAVMLGLAVGIDYCLFILDRFRAELRAGRGVTDAIGWAVGTAGSSVVFAGATVIIALAGLSVVGIPFVTEMGLAAAFAVLIAVLMALTFLPVLMRTMGARALPRRRKPAHGTADRITFLDRWISLVVHRPAVTALTATALLLVVAIPVLSLRTTLNNPGGEDPESTRRAAYTIIAEKFGAGSQDPLVVLVQSDRGQARGSLTAATAYLKRFADVEQVYPGPVSGDGTTAQLTVIPRSGPLEDATKQLVRDIRSGAGSVPGVRLLVTGGTALGIDSDEKLSNALEIYLVLIVGLSLVLLIIMFRSILVPLIATAGFLLSLGAGMGSTVAVFQWGWLDALVAAPQGNPLLSLLPIILTGILFGLAMDYQVFLVSRIHEAHARGLSPKEAILDGFGRAAVVVVAAAGIMTAVFTGFALSPSSLVGSIALGLAVGVVADAFVVRMILVPATLAMLGPAAWWMPSWLDRILPHLDTEGANLGTATERPLPLVASAR